MSEQGPYSVKNDDVMGWMTFGPGQSAMSYIGAYGDDEPEKAPNIYCYNLNVAFEQGVSSQQAQVKEWERKWAFLKEKFPGEVAHFMDKMEVGL